MPNEITEEQAIPYSDKIKTKTCFAEDKHQFCTVKAFVSTFPQTTFLKFPPGENYAP